MREAQKIMVIVEPPVTKEHREILKKGSVHNVISFSKRGVFVQGAGEKVLLLKGEFEVIF